MTSNVRTLLNEVNARIKIAEAKVAEDPSNFDSFPGAENDKPVAAETKKPDPEVKDGGPAERTEATGAKPGSDDKVNQDHLYEADEPILTPDKKPAESADANAKVAADKNPEIAKVAADIMSIIRKGLSTKKEAEAKTEAPKTEKVEKTAEEQKTEAQKTEKVEKEAAAQKKEEKVEKRAKDDTVSLSESILQKIAAARKERTAKEAAMAKKASVKAGIVELVKAASEYKRGAKDAETLIKKLAQALEESAASGEAADAGEAAAAAGADAGAAAEAAGAADAAAAVADAGAAGGDDAVTPEEVQKAVQELVEEGQISAEDAATLTSGLGGDDAGAGEVTEEDLANGIANAVASGEITEDEAQQLVTELIAAGADESLASDAAGAAGADAEAAGAADAAAAVDAADAEAGAAAATEAADAADAANKTAEAKTEKPEEQKTEKTAEDEQIARYQKGFVEKCAELGVDPQAVAQYIQAKAKAEEGQDK